jgi:prevent-host-death family protein
MPTLSKPTQGLETKPRRVRGREAAATHRRARSARTVVITVTASKAREEFSTWVNLVGHGHKWIVLKRHGKPTVAMVPVADLEALRQLEDTLDLQAAREAMSEPGEVSWEEVKAKLGL